MKFFRIIYGLFRTEQLSADTQAE